MEDNAPVRAVSATLMPDCSIELEVSLPGWDEPQMTVIEQSSQLPTRVGTQPRAIDLEGLDSMDLICQQLIAAHVGKIGPELERQRAYEQYRQKMATPSVSTYDQ